jgi:hypothetical protein
MWIVLRSAAFPWWAEPSYCANQRGMDLTAPALVI